MSGGVPAWVGKEELAAHYLARVDHLAQEVRFAHLGVTWEPGQSSDSWWEAVEARRESFLAEIKGLRDLARGLVPDPFRYATVAIDALGRAADARCAQCFGRVFIPAGEDGNRPPGTVGDPLRGSDGASYWRCGESHEVAQGAVPPL